MTNNDFSILNDETFEMPTYIATILGGAGAVRTMTGCKVFAHGKNGLFLDGLKRTTFKRIVIKYNEATDLFDVQFRSWNGIRSGIRDWKVEEVNGVFIDQLKSLCETKTGLYFTLF